MKKEYTPFGKYFSQLRKERKQSITEAANLLGVSIAYISAVEHGDREIPSNWRKKIIDVYSLDKEEEEKLNKAYFDTPTDRKVSRLEVETAMINMINNLIEDEKEKEEAIKDLKRRLNELTK